MNAIHIIQPYRFGGTWVFDDARVGLDHEPFVGGADVILDILVARAGIEDAEHGFAAMFSSTPFPGSTAIQWQREDCGGNVYRDGESGQEGWLCPALFRYFETAPPTIYVLCRGRG